MTSQDVRIVGRNLVGILVVANLDQPKAGAGGNKGGSKGEKDDAGVFLP